MRAFPLFLGVLIVSTPLCAKETESTIRLSISPAGWGLDGGYVAGHPISIRCVFENIGQKSVQFLLQDHHPYHGTLPFPTGMKATVWDASGKPIVNGWSQYVLWSTAFDEMPGDRITLEPGAKVVRIVPLDQILIGAIPSLGPGLYRVQLTMPEAASNVLTIEVKERPNHLQEATPGQRPLAAPSPSSGAPQR